MEYRCPFNQTMTADQFGCAHASHVVRRTGPDVACGSEPAQARCAQALERLKAVALPAFGADDDPLTMPHSMLVKIGMGGLLGLQRLVAPHADPDRVDDIDGLLGRCAERFGGLDGAPWRELEGAMTGYRLVRRKR